MKVSYHSPAHYPSPCDIVPSEVSTSSYSFWVDLSNSLQNGLSSGQSSEARDPVLMSGYAPGLPMSFDENTAFMAPRMDNSPESPLAHKSTLGNDPTHSSYHFPYLVAQPNHAGRRGQTMYSFDPCGMPPWAFASTSVHMHMPTSQHKMDSASMSPIGIPQQEEVEDDDVEIDNSLDHFLVSCRK